MRSASLSVARGIAVAILVVLAGAASGAPSLKSWRDGPVSELLTDDEYRRFGELRTEGARKAFIDEFWRTLDGSPGAPAGGYRTVFEQRCADADLRFQSGGAQGWRSDRGRVYVALGEPSSIRHEWGGVNALEREIWTYGAGQDDPAAFRMEFYRCTDGVYRVDPSCLTRQDPTSVSFDDERADYLRKLQDTNAEVATGRILAMLADVMQPVPGGVPLPRPEALRLAAGRGGTTPQPAVAPASPGIHALDDASYFFRAQDGSVLTMLTVQLLRPSDAGSANGDADDATGFLGAATLEESGRRGEPLPEAAPHTIPLEAAPATGGGDRAIFFGRVYLQAGKTYAVRYAVKDEKRDEILVRNAVVGVPELAHGFSASSIVPAAQFGPATPGSDRFQIGSESVVPKPGGVFRRSELLRLYLQVYDAAVDPKTGRARVDVVFRFYRLTNGPGKRYGKPFSVRGAAGASMGLALPIGDWPAGPYRVEVDLHDRVVEQRTLAEGRFTIAAE